MSTSTEYNKNLASQFYELVFNQKDLSAIRDFIHIEAIDHNPTPDQEPGILGIEKGLESFLEAFPDLHITLDVILAEGDLVAVRYTMTATHQGTFAYIPATGRTVVMTGIDVVQIVDGKMAQRWGNSSDLDTFSQLGVFDQS